MAGCAPPLNDDINENQGTIMSYTTVSIIKPGSAWDGIEAGSEEWAALFATTQDILARHNAEQVWNGWVPGLAANVSIQNYPDRDAALRSQYEFMTEKLLDYVHGGEGIPMEDYVGVVG